MAEEEKPVAKTQQQRNAERFRKLEDGFKENSVELTEFGDELKEFQKDVTVEVSAELAEFRNELMHMRAYIDRLEVIIHRLAGSKSWWPEAKKKLEKDK